MNLQQFLEEDERESMQPYLLEFYDVYKEYQKQKGAKAQCIDYFMARKFLQSSLEKHHNKVLSEVQSEVEELYEVCDICENQERHDTEYNRTIDSVVHIIENLKTTINK